MPSLYRLATANLGGLQFHIIKLHVRDDTFTYNQFKMTEQTDYSSMPLDELEKMVAGIPTSQMDTENPEPEEQKEEGASTETTSDTPNQEEPKVEDKPEEKGEPAGE